MVIQKNAGHVKIKCLVGFEDAVDSVNFNSFKAFSLCTCTFWQIAKTYLVVIVLHF